MTGAAVFNQALREVRAVELGLESERDFVAALEAARPGPSELFYNLAHEAGLARDELLLRSAGLFLAFAAGNLADDLIDGDCDYLSRPHEIGPSVQFGLQHLAYAVLLRSKDTTEATRVLARTLAMAGGVEHLEHGDWTMDRFVRVAEGIAGLQWQAYLPVLWAGRRGSAAEGRTLGLVLHLAEDIRTRDRRFISLSDAEREAVMRWGLSLVEDLRATDSACLRGVADAVEPVFVGAQP